MSEIPPTGSSIFSITLQTDAEARPLFFEPLPFNCVTPDDNNTNWVIFVTFLQFMHQSK